MLEHQWFSVLSQNILCISESRNQMFSFSWTWVGSYVHTTFSNVHSCGNFQRWVYINDYKCMFQTLVFKILMFTCKYTSFYDYFQHHVKQSAMNILEKLYRCVILPIRKLDVQWCMDGVLFNLRKSWQSENCSWRKNYCDSVQLELYDIKCFILWRRLCSYTVFLFIGNGHLNVLCQWRCDCS